MKEHINNTISEYLSMGTNKADSKEASVDENSSCRGCKKYPWHMPGHKRKTAPWDSSSGEDGRGAAAGENDENNSKNRGATAAKNCENNEVGAMFCRDLTEVPGLDDLHHPTGMIKDSLEEAAKVYGSYKTYYLVNGATCGNLAALFAYVNSEESVGGNTEYIDHKQNGSEYDIRDNNRIAGKVYSGQIDGGITGSMKSERIYDRGAAERRDSSPKEKTVIVARNCHKSVFNAVKLLGVKPVYVYPSASNEVSIDGEITAESIRKAIEKNPGKDIRCCIITSPTYEGVISDIKAISECLHDRGIPLIVDEAHGAHFPFYRMCDNNIKNTTERAGLNDDTTITGQKESGFKYPCSSLYLGADIVIQSLHKTLPCYTQTAVLHVADRIRKKLMCGVDKKKCTTSTNGSVIYDDMKAGELEKLAQRIEEYLSIFQTSSPSYVFIQAMEKCIAWCDANREKFVKHFERIIDFRRSFDRAGMKNLRLFSYDTSDLTERETAGCRRIEQIEVRDIAENSQNALNINAFCDYVSQDITRLVFMVKGIAGKRAAELLEEKKGLVFEMAGIDYLVAISTFMDDEEDFAELLSGLKWLDEEITNAHAVPIDGNNNQNSINNGIEWKNNRQITSESVFLMTDSGKCTLKEAIGKRITDYIYVYPPGIPIIAPFELIDEKHVSEILHDICAGYEMRGNGFV